MPLKITTNQDFKNLSKLLPEARSKFAIDMKNSISDVIIKEMEKGTSPVKGFNPYKKKADGTPARLFKTGALYESVKTKQKSNGSVTISVGSREVPYAQYHQYGTKNLDARPILPTTGLQFKSKVLNEILKIARKAVRLATNRRG